MEDGCFNGSSSRQQYKTSSVSRQFKFGDKLKHSNKGESFVKVLKCDFSKKLQIPLKFTRYFNGCRPHRFIIETGSTRNCWRVEVEEDGDGRMYLGDGWADFVEAHMLEAGNVLVFEYEEQSIFHVKIYSKDGCEKTPVDAKLASHQNLEETTVSEDDGEFEASDYEQEILVNNHREKRRKLSLRKYEQRIHKKKRTTNKDHMRAQSDKRDPIPTASKELISDESVCFSITLHKTKRHQMYKAVIPKAVVDKKLLSKEKVILEDANGNVWPVKVNKNRITFLGSGWRVFLIDNNITPGDTIDFKFISDERIQFDVARSSEIEHHCREANYQTKASESKSFSMHSEHDEPDACATNDQTGEASITRKKVSSDAKTSSFSVIWRKNPSSCCYLYVPMAVVREQNLKDKESVVLRDPEGKCWPLEVRTWRGGHVGLVKGWSDFWKGNDIRTGDSMSFEFVSECLIQVTINRHKPLKPATEGPVMKLETIDDERAANEVKEIDNGGEADIEPEIIVID